MPKIVNLSFKRNVKNGFYPKKPLLFTLNVQLQILKSKANKPMSMYCKLYLENLFDYVVAQFCSLPSQQN